MERIVISLVSCKNASSGRSEFRPFCNLNAGWKVCVLCDEIHAKQRSGYTRMKNGKNALGNCLDRRFCLRNYTNTTNICANTPRLLSLSRRRSLVHLRAFHSCLYSFTTCHLPIWLSIGPNFVAHFL